MPLPVTPSQPRPLDTRGTLLTLLNVGLFGFEAVANKLILQSLSPLLTSAVTFSLGGLCVLAWAHLQGQRLRPSDARGLAWQIANILVFSLITFLLLSGLQQVPAGWGNALLSSFPVWVFVWSTLILRTDRLTPGRTVGLAVALVGLYLLTGDASVSAVGAAWMMAGAATLGGQVCLVQRVARREGPVATLAWQHLGAGVVCGTAALLTGLQPADAQPMDLQRLLALGYVALVVNAFAFLSHTTLLARHPATDVSAFYLLRPFVGLLAAWLVLAEPVGPRLVLAAALVALGVLVVVRSPPKPVA